MADPGFVARDRELEGKQERASEQLARHRWHWTLDETNPQRVSLREYARQIGRALSPVQAMVHGYAAWRAASDRDIAVTPGAPVLLSDFIEQAKLGAEKAEATQAVAAASGKSFGNVAGNQRAEVKAVLETARDRAERKGTSVSDELPAVAEWREKSRTARQNERQERRASNFLLVEMEGHIGAAIRRLRDALAIARDVDFSEEQVELIAGSLDSLRTIVQLIDVRISGTSGIDWEAEFAEVMKELS